MTWEDAMLTEAEETAVRSDCGSLGWSDAQIRERLADLRGFEAAASQAALEAAGGARVLWVTRRQVEARAALDAVRSASPVEPSKVILANGHERIDYPSFGTVAFVSTERRARGFEADIAYLHNASPDAATAAGFCVAASSRPDAGVRRVNPLAGLGRLVTFLDQELGIVVQPWQLTMLEHVLTGERQTNARPSQDP